MLGRVRASPISSLELLEMERSSSKISKLDSLSIYGVIRGVICTMEPVIRHFLSNIYKIINFGFGFYVLKQGSQCCQSSTSGGFPTTYTHSTIATDPPEEIMSDTDFSSPESSPNLSGAHSSNEKRSTSMSIIYMFSNYKLSKHAESSTNTKDMDIECRYSSSSSFSPTINGS